MKKSAILITFLCVLVWTSVSFGLPVAYTRIHVYKATIKASKSIVDVNDTEEPLSLTVSGYWAVSIVENEPYRGAVTDANAVLYDKKNKDYKIIPDELNMNPIDPCGTVMLYFFPEDTDGSFRLHVVGKGKLTKFTSDTGVAKDYIPTALKGAGLLDEFDFFDTCFAYSGSVTVTMKLDSKWTLRANDNDLSVDQVLNEIVADLTDGGGWTRWPYVPAP